MSDKEWKITLKKSLISRLPKQRSTLKALGLRKINGSVVHKATPQIRGMVKAVEFMVSVEEL